MSEVFLLKSYAVVWRGMVYDLKDRFFVGRCFWPGGFSGARMSERDGIPELYVERPAFGARLDLVPREAAVWLVVALQRAWRKRNAVRLLKGFALTWRGRLYVLKTRGFLGSCYWPSFFEGGRVVETRYSCHLHVKRGLFEARLALEPRDVSRLRTLQRAGRKRLCAAKRAVQAWTLHRRLPDFPPDVAACIVRYVLWN